jgi:hypothetical protein
MLGRQQKRIPICWGLGAFLLWAFAATPAAAQGQRVQPDCVIDFSLTAAGQTQGGLGTCGTNLNGILQWTVTYKSTGFSVLSLRVESAPDAGGGVPGAWGAFAGTLVNGINPNTSITAASAQFSGFQPFVRVALTSKTGTGVITGELYGCRQPGCSGGFATTHGTVTNVATGCGLTGGPITTTGTIQRTEAVNLQSGASYNLLNSDCGTAVVLTNLGPSITVNVPQAGAGGMFPAGWFVDIIGQSSAISLMPTVSTIQGGSAYTINASAAGGNGVRLVSNGTNYYVLAGNPPVIPTVSAGCGVLVSGGPAYTVASSWPTDAQTGGTYAIRSTDCGSQLTFSNAGGVAVSLAQSGSGGFPSGWFTIVKNIGTGDVIITPAVSTISGAASITISTGEFCILTSDGANYEGNCNRAIQGANMTLTKTRTGTTFASSAPGTGTVTNIATGCGLSGGPITTTGTLVSSWPANAVSAASYTVLGSDCGKQVTFSNAGATAVALPQAGTAGFPAGWFTVVKTIGAGDTTVTGTVSTISGAASIVISTGEYCILTSDGANYEANCVRNIQGSGMTLTKTRSGVTFSAAAQLHTITFAIEGASGAAITTGDLKVFPTVAFACTINRIDVSADQSGSITVDIWKRAGAIPTSAQKISASAPATLASAQLSQAGSLSGWSTAVSSGDVFGGTIVTVATVTLVTIQIWCS